MIQNALLSVSKTLLIVVFALTSLAATAQMKPKLPGADYQNFLKTQWWLGLRFGVNYAQPNLKKSYSSIDPIDYSIDSVGKSYDNFKTPGVQIGLDITFYTHGFSIGLQPTFKTMNYSYSSNMTRSGSAPEDQFDTNYKVDQKLSYIELPIALRYEIIQKGKVRPFVQAGVQYSFLMGAKKEAVISHTEYTTGVPLSFGGGNVNVDVKNEFKNYYGAFGGLGTGFDFFNIRTVFEVNYHYGLSTISNTNARFDSNELSSFGEVSDKLNLNHISASLSFVFPLRYIDNTFNAY